MKPFRCLLVAVLGLWLALPVDAFPASMLRPRGLKFGAATSDAVRVSPATLINHTQASAFTVMLWLRWDSTATASVAFYSKLTGGDRGPRYRLTGTTDIQVAIRRATAQDNYATNNFGIVASVPRFLAVTYDEADTRHLRVYKGSLTSGAEECTYTTEINGSGAWDDTAADLLWGNTPSATPINAHTGVIWAAAEANVRLTVDEMDAWRTAVLRGGRGFAVGRGMVAAYNLGANGNGPVLDLSGHSYHGAPAGVIPSPDLLPRIGLRRIPLAIF